MRKKHINDITKEKRKKKERNHKKNRKTNSKIQIKDLLLRKDTTKQKLSIDCFLSNANNN